MGEVVNNIDDNMQNDIFNQFFNSYINKMQKQQNKKEVWGYKTDFTDYDTITNGLHNSELTVIAARHSMGKTTFVLNLALNLAKQSIPVLYISYDMSKEGICERLISILSEIESDKIKKGSLLDEKSWNKITDAFENLEKLLNNKYLNLISSCTLYYKDLFDKIREFKNEHKNGVIIVDYFQLIKLYRPEDTRIVELSSLAAAFKHLTMEIELPVILISQVSKKCEDRQDKKPILSDLAECDALAQHSDNLIFLYRNEYYNPEDIDAKNKAQFIVAKQKNGCRNEFELIYIPQIYKFKNPVKTQECYF